MKYTLATIGLILLALTSGVYYHSSKNLKSTSDGEEFMFERSYFKLFQEESDLIQNENTEKLSSSVYGSIISYRVNHNLQFHQNPKDLGQQSSIQNIRLEAHCDVQPLYNRSRNLIELAVSYHKIDKGGFEHMVHVPSDAESSLGSISTSNTSQGELQTGEKTMGSYQSKTHQDRFYIVSVEASSGKVLSMKAENGVEEDQHMNWVTQQLVNDIMPESRMSSYSSRVYERDNLGKINVRYSAQNHDSQTLKINKQYSHSDYREIHAQHMFLPTINYHRDVYVHKNTGIAHSGKTQHDFELGKNEYARYSQHDFAHDYMGKMNGSISQQFTKIATSGNYNELTKEMKRYRQEMEMHSVELHEEFKGSVQYGNGNHVNMNTEAFVEDDHITIAESGRDNYFGTYSRRVLEEEEQVEEKQEEIEEEEGKGFLGAGEPLLYSHSHSMAQLKVFHQKIHADLAYSVYKSTSKLEVDIMVNDRIIDRLASISWNNCKNKPMDNQHSKNITLFKATFPLFGIITIPVSASLRLDYGWRAAFSSWTRHCDFQLHPYFKAALYAQGQASIFKVVSAGIYSQGTFLDASLSFQMKSENGQSSVALSGDYRAFTLDIGATWTKYNCSPRHWFRQGYEEKQEEEVQSVVGKEGRRQLHWHHHFHLHRLVHRITHVVKKAVRVYNKVSKIFRSTVPEIIGLFCRKSQGFKQLVKKSSPQHHKQWFNKSINFGI